jgi:acetoin utilization protein AcuC
VSASLDALFVGNDVYRRAAFGKNHPLSIARVEKVRELCDVLNWFEPNQYRASPVASEEQLLQYHSPDYVNALKAADRDGHVSRSDRVRYGFGTMENPLFSGVFERASSAVGGSIHAANLAADGRVVFHPAGGTHHAWPDKARGFCYFNDPVFAVLQFLELGLQRVLYVDLDAHHGDGVQHAFDSDPRVRTLSMHEAGRWPNTGELTDTGSNGFACNIPVPSQLGDAELARISAELLIPYAQAFEPEAIVFTCGADACESDPLSSMALSNSAQWLVVKELANRAPAVVVLGGGGYNPWTLIRYWAGLWATLAGKVMPESFDAKASAVFDGLECDLIDDDEIDPEWTRQLADPAQSKSVRPEIQTLIEQVSQHVSWDDLKQAEKM